MAKSYTDEGRRLAAVLSELGVTPTELGRRLDLATPYGNVKQWIDGRGFSERNQARAAKELGLPPGFFGGRKGHAPSKRGRSAPPRKPALKGYSEAWEAFLLTEEAQHAEAEQLAVLARRKYDGTPTLATYLLGLLELQSVRPDKSG